MNSGLGLCLTFGIGFVAGLRSMTAPAVVAWAAHLGWINLSGTPLAFMGSIWAVAIFTLGALAEYVADQLPTLPHAPFPSGWVRELSWACLREHVLASLLACRFGSGPS